MRNCLYPYRRQSGMLHICTKHPYIMSFVNTNGCYYVSIDTASFFRWCGSFNLQFLNDTIKIHSNFAKRHLMKQHFCRREAIAGTFVDTYGISNKHMIFLCYLIPLCRRLEWCNCKVSFPIFY